MAEWAPPSAGDSKPRPRPVALRPASFHSRDRDWVLYLECRADAVVLYPSRSRFPLAALTSGPDNPLARAVNRMVQRRQASVAPGDAPYRPQLRFLVRPEALQAFLQAYSTLDALPVAKTRQNLQPEDDVNQIVAGP